MQQREILTQPIFFQLANNRLSDKKPVKTMLMLVQKLIPFNAITEPIIFTVSLINLRGNEATFFEAIKCSTQIVQSIFRVCVRRSQFESESKWEKSV